jgi:hypothetical protein
VLLCRYNGDQNKHSFSRIVDWKLYEETPSDQATLIESLDRLEQKGSQLKPKAVIGDRGFLSKQGFPSREIGLASQILAHNLWVIARLPRKQEDIPLDLAA